MIQQFWNFAADILTWNVASALELPVFEAVAVIDQYQMNNGAQIFDV